MDQVTDAQILVGEIESKNLMCDCGHAANAHEQFTGQCTKNGCGCPFHSYLDPFSWDEWKRGDFGPEPEIDPFDMLSLW